MKNICYLLGFMFAVSMMVSCEDEEGSKVNLDPNLIGYWVFVDNNDEVLAWRFNDNGTAVQTSYETDYNWRWEIEDGQLKLFVSGGVPVFYTYKIEGNLLYLWVDQIGDWGLPFTRQ